MTAPRTAAANWTCDSPKNDIIDRASKDDLSSMLECPYCLDIPLPPVYLCLTGHIICSSCRLTLDHCGLCTSAFKGTRNFFYENLFEKMTFRCKYVAEGCKEVMDGKVLKAHQTTCDFRPIPCIKYGCVHSKAGKYVAYAKYLSHLKEEHQARFNSGRIGTVYNGYNDDANFGDVSRWVHEAFQFKGHTFFVNCQARKPEIGIWLWYFGSAADAKKFRVKITLGDNSNGFMMSWEGPVHSIRKPYEDIMDEGQCLSTTSQGIKPLRKEADRPYWEVKFEIKEVDYVRTTGSGFSAGRANPRLPHQNCSNSTGRNGASSSDEAVRGAASLDQLFPRSGPNRGPAQLPSRSRAGFSRK